MLLGAIPPLQHILGNVLPFCVNGFLDMPASMDMSVIYANQSGSSTFLPEIGARISDGRETSDVATLAFRSDSGAFTLLVDEGAQAFQFAQ